MQPFHIIYTNIIESFSATGVICFGTQGTDVVGIGWQCFDQCRIVEIAVMCQRQYNAVMIGRVFKYCIIWQR